jgi:hypothetical protein
MKVPYGALAGIAGAIVGPALYLGSIVGPFGAFERLSGTTVPNSAIVAMMAADAVAGACGLFAGIRMLRRRPGIGATFLVATSSSVLFTAIVVPLIAWLTIVPGASTFPG